MEIELLKQQNCINLVIFFGKMFKENEKFPSKWKFSCSNILTPPEMSWLIPSNAAQCSDVPYPILLKLSVKLYSITWLGEGDRERTSQLKSFLQGL